MIKRKFIKVPSIPVNIGSADEKSLTDQPDWLELTSLLG